MVIGFFVQKIRAGEQSRFGNCVVKARGTVMAVNCGFSDASIS
jgi:hypothetical protein